ncbi:MAG: RNA polymerase sigma factor [Acidobacteria bacterium]|nr:RNA polymerase sigma factor [Acidobacteriota bacterium]
MPKFLSSNPAPSSVEKAEVASAQESGEVPGLSEAEFRGIYERHAAEILRYAIRCVGRREIAEEIASEAFLKMHLNRDRIFASRAAAWLTAAVKNQATDYWRRQQVERRHAALAEPDAAAEPEPEQDWRALLGDPALKPEHRVCLALHYVHGMSRGEISARTGLSDNQVKNALQYGLKLLRRSLGPKEGGP